MSSIRVSIIIPVYNGSNYLQEAIESALAQTYENVEVIVINDGSCDDGKTREIALTYGNRIRYYEKENGGVSTALNLGISEMTGDYFSWLSHDDLYVPTKVEAEIEAIKKSGTDKQIVYSNYANIRMPEKRVGETAILSELYDENLLTDGMWATVLWLIHGCSLLIPKELFDEYGNFDTNYRGTQDYFKWFDMFIDKRLIYVDKVLVYNRIHSEQQGKYLGKRHKQENEKLMIYAIKRICTKYKNEGGFDIHLLLCILFERAEAYDIENAVEYAKQCLREYQKPEQVDVKQKEFLELFEDNCKIYIYGAGKRGKKLLKLLNRRNIRVPNFIDANSKKWHTKIDGVECVGIEDITDKNCPIVITPAKADEVWEGLRAENYNNLYSYQYITAKLSFIPFLI